MNVRRFIPDVPTAGGTVGLMSDVSKMGAMAVSRSHS